MIEAIIYKSDGEALCGFKVTSHGEGIVCAAVSVLCQNAINSIETLTEAPLEYCYDKGGGYLECILPGALAGTENPEAALLLRSLELGLQAVRDEYGSGKGGMTLATEVVTPDKTINKAKRFIEFKR